MIDPTLSICVPVFNEAENLPLLHDAIAAVIDPAGISAEIILVDDGSTDESWPAIESLVARDPRVRGIKFKSNCGETAASDAGLRAALRAIRHDHGRRPSERSEGHPQIPRSARSGIRLCLRNSRVASRGEGDGFVRVASSRIANWVRNQLSDEEISDGGCTYRAFRRECIAKLKLYRGLHRFIPTLLKMEGFTVAEIPVTNHPRLHGRSKYGVWNRLFKSFRDLLAIRWMKSRLLGYEIAAELDRTREPTEAGQ